MQLANYLAGNLPAFVLLATLLGLLVGSFLNVVIYRLPVMMQRDWRKQAREILELPEEPEQGTFNLVLAVRAGGVRQDKVEGAFSRLLRQLENFPGLLAPIALHHYRQTEDHHVEEAANDQPE